MNETGMGKEGATPEGAVDAYYLFLPNARPFTYFQGLLTYCLYYWL